MNGWIKIHRQLMDDPIWTSEPFTAGQAWIDLLMLTDRKTATVTETVSGLAKRWKWTWHKTKRYLEKLQKEGKITATNSATNERPIARPIELHIIKWKEYQGENAPRPIARPKGDQKTDDTSENLPFYINTRNNKEGEKNARARVAPPQNESAADFFLRIAAESEENDDKK